MLVAPTDELEQQVDVAVRVAEVVEEARPRTPARLVPLPTQATEILRDLLPLTGPTGPIFCSMAKRSEATRYTSDNTVNSALRTLGYDTQEQITGHGFRATARTLIRELLGWDREVIERHLAHVSDEELGGSYDRVTHLDQRHQMIQLWANLLDDLTAGQVLPTSRLRSHRVLLAAADQ